MKASALTPSLASVPLRRPCSSCVIANLYLYRVVPENVQKKQARDAKLLKDLKERRDRERKERVEKRKTLRANAEKYHKEYTKQAADLVAARRAAKNAGNFFVEPEAKLAFVIRTRG